MLDNLAREARVEPVGLALERRPGEQLGGHSDTDGALRRGDLIISGGENVWPDRVEHEVGPERRRATPPDDASREDVDYLLRTANYFFPAAKLTSEDVVCAWAGIRPLVAGRFGADPSAGPGATSGRLGVPERRESNSPRLEIEFDCIRKMREWMIGQGITSEDELSKLEREMIAVAVASYILLEQPIRQRRFLRGTAGLVAGPVIVHTLA